MQVAVSQQLFLANTFVHCSRLYQWLELVGIFFVENIVGRVLEFLSI